MEDHPLTFVVMAVYGLVMLACYSVKVAWLAVALIFKGFQLLYKKIMKIEREEVNNNVVR